MSIDKSIKIDHMYYFLFGLMIFFRLLRKSELDYILPLDSLFYTVSFALLFVAVTRIFRFRTSLKIWITIFITISIFLLNLFISKDIEMFSTFLIILFTRYDEVNKMIRTGIFALIGTLFLVLSFWLIGLVGNTQFIRLGVIRNTFGFKMPTVIPGVVANISISLLYLSRNKKNSIKKVFFLVFLNFIVMSFINGRTSFFIVTTIAIFSLFSSRLTQHRKERYAVIMGKLLVIQYFLEFLLSIFISANYSSGNSIINQLSGLFSGRFYFWNRFWNIYSIKIFGQQIERVSSLTYRTNQGSQMMILDNAFLTLLLENGLLVTIILSISIFKLSKRLAKNGDMFSVFAWMMIVAGFFTAGGRLSLENNLLLLQITLLFSKSFYEKNTITQDYIIVNPSNS